jgi:ribosome assembly protein YihI (activator of Der GTPase)
MASTVDLQCQDQSQQIKHQGNDTGSIAAGGESMSNSAGA